ncbi:MAG: winged helix-turn-helix domain-containing protein [Acetobacteraceae bacterium]
MSRAASSRMYAIAHALDGMSRAVAARLAGMERQALRDAVVRYNAEGLAGLRDRPRPGPKPRLDEAERKGLSELILQGPDVEASGLSAWTLAELCSEIATRWGKRFHPASLSRVVRRLGFSRQKARQVHPQSDKEAQAAFQKGGSPTRWRRSARRIPASA